MANASKPTSSDTRKQAVIYARVSSKEQEKEGFSIPAQLKLLRSMRRRKASGSCSRFSGVGVTHRNAPRPYRCEACALFCTPGEFPGIPIVAQDAG